MSENWQIDGIDPDTGAPVAPALSVADMAAMARGRPEDAPNYAALLRFADPWLGGGEAEAAPAEPSRQEIMALKQRADAKGQKTLGLMDGYDGTQLASAGWGLVFAQDDPQAPAIREALAELIAHRKQAAGNENPQRFRDDLVYVPGQTKTKWQADYNAGPGRVNPDLLPYYLLLVGDVARIPWRFQSQLGVQHAVGRLFFEDIAGYKAYADSVLSSERGEEAKATREALFFCPETDSPVRKAKANLLDPLRAQAEAAGWKTDGLYDEDATGERLATRLTDAPSRLLITSTHGASRSTIETDADRRLQGALRCAPRMDTRWFSGDRISDAMDLRGTISVHTACFGAGTPRMDSLAQAVTKGQRVAPKSSAPTDQVAWLGQRMLSLRNGALAFVGHVDRTCNTSWVAFSEGRKVENRGHFTDMLGRLLQGHPVGWALDPFGDWFSEKDSTLRSLIDAEPGEEPTDEELGYAWLSAKDASGWVILGDPATRLRV